MDERVEHGDVKLSPGAAEDGGDATPLLAVTENEILFTRVLPLLCGCSGCSFQMLMLATASGWR